LPAVIDPGRWLALAATAFAIIVVPGPSVLFVISRGVTLGRRAGLATVVGNTAGLAVQLVAVIVGLGAVVERSIVAFTVVKVAGALYLVYLGVQAVRHRRRLADAFAAGVEPKGVGRIFREGFLVGVTNPKSIILFTAILPQFADPTRGHVPVQLAVLGITCLVIALTSDSVWALAAGTARQWLGRRPERLAVIGGVGGLVTIGLGVRLALTGRRD
jgi:threonine/homoserine/homoserine lactone efflux protein